MLIDPDKKRVPLNPQWYLDPAKKPDSQAAQSVDWLDHILCDSAYAWENPGLYFSFVKQ